MSMHHNKELQVANRYTGVSAFRPYSAKSMDESECDKAHRIRDGRTENTRSEETRGS